MPMTRTDRGSVHDQSAASPSLPSAVYHDSRRYHKTVPTCRAASNDEMAEFDYTVEHIAGESRTASRMRCLDGQTSIRRVLCTRSETVRASVYQRRRGSTVGITSAALRACVWTPNRGCGLFADRALPEHRHVD